MILIAGYDLVGEHKSFKDLWDRNVPWKYVPFPIWPMEAPYKGVFYNQSNIKMETNPKQTLGEYRVGITFNPSNNPLVETFKQKAAVFIDSAIAPFERPKKVEPKAEAQAANDDDIQKAEMETVDVRPTAHEKANEFRADCSLQNAKTENFEGKRCFIAADKFMAQAVNALNEEKYEDAQVLAEIAAMFAVKGVTKPEKPSHL